MLISYNWLRELTDTKLTPLEIRERLTMVGLAIDAVDEVDGDAVIDVEVPSNRPDCLSHVGIAREVAVIEKSTVQSPKSTVPKTEGKAADSTSVVIDDAGLCPRYAARLIRGVKIGPSPAWLEKRLGEIGQRPINNVADITNYVLHELGQPLHAFDLAKLNEQRIVVRRARPGETLTTLDGVKRNLTEQMLVIADASQPVALAGIMGGQDSEISTTTIDVLIESAYFNPDSVRRTARQLGMDTEASRRFERGADCENVLNAQARCVELICEIAGGVATEDAIDVYPQPVRRRTVRFRPEKVESLTSLRVDVGEMKRILSALGFTLNESAQKGELSFVVPSWRVDVGLEEDLIEEIARHTGYEKIASELPPSNLAGEYQPAETRRRSLRRALNSLGFDEAIDLSFISATHNDTFAVLPGLHNETGGNGLVLLKNPIIEEADRMRPTLLPGLVESVRHNLNHGNRDVSLFEIGRIFANSAAGELPLEREALGLIATGAALEEGRAQTAGETDFYRLKGALEAGVDAMKVGSLVFAKGNVKHLREGQSARVLTAEGNEIGSIGRLAESIAAEYKFRQPVYVAEIDFTALIDAAQRTTQYTPLPRYPSVVRDITLLVSRDVSFGELAKSINQAEIADYAGVRLVGTYEGPNIPEDKRSISLRLEYRSQERTLKDDEVDERNQRLRESLVKKFNAELH
jgi:phenylalanyl-tRNA synthetase beta chain